MIAQFHLLHTDMERPSRLNDPFDYEPHALSMMAAESVCKYIDKVEAWQPDLEAGKMLGVLVCQTADGSLGFLTAYSGLLAGRNDWDYFVPPVFDAQQPDGHFKQTERQISAINDEVRRLETLTPLPAERLCELKQQRRQMSEELQLWLFRQYRMLNARGEEKDLVEIWRDYHPSERILQKFPIPPGGSGDCCAPKLLQYAYKKGLRPLAIAEFWQGASPRGEIRHHGHYYPACSGKCKPILAHMLEGIDVDRRLPKPPTLPIDILYEDNAVMVVNKPAGLLTVPGRNGLPSVVSMLRERHPEATGPMMVHRLDMDTSGLLAVALTPEAYHHLQQQFLERTIGKRYVALLQTPSPTARERLLQQPEGMISLPLLPDPLDRPRQVADPVKGKQAVTEYKLLDAEGLHPRITLIPHTGRTHQLRVHCAHHAGLGCPILGDPLYGLRSDRLYLHAEKLSFRHPISGKAMEFQQPAPF